jgi:hypothetical protein
MVIYIDLARQRRRTTVLGTFLKKIELVKISRAMSCLHVSCIILSEASYVADKACVYTRYNIVPEPLHVSERVSYQQVVINSEKCLFMNFELGSWIFMLFPLGSTPIAPGFHFKGPVRDPDQSKDRPKSKSGKNIILIRT